MAGTLAETRRMTLCPGSSHVAEEIHRDERCIMVCGACGQEVRVGFQGRAVAHALPDGGLPMECAPHEHNFQPRSERVQSGFTPHQLESRYIGDRCTKCGKWESKPWQRKAEP